MGNIIEIKFAQEVKDMIKASPIVSVPDSNVLQKIISANDLDFLKITKTIDCPIKIIDAVIVDNALIEKEF